MPCNTTRAFCVIFVQVGTTPRKKKGKGYTGGAFSVDELSFEHFVRKMSTVGSFMSLGGGRGGAVEMKG